MKKTVFVLLITSFFVSCIPNKDLIYLQEKNTDKDAIEIKQEVSKPYRAQVNDMLSITIKAIDQKLVSMFTISSDQNQANSQQALYFNGYTVDDHGNIRVPVLGELNVLGYTMEEIRNTIEKKLLDDYFKTEANIFVTVKLAGLRYTINGEVGSPGTNVLYQDKVTIMEAIANSGDITLTGNRKEVQVIRKFPHGFETHYLDLTDAKTMDSPYFYVQPNDYIIVKPLKQKSWGTGTTGVQTITTVVSALTLVTTVILLSKNL
ncbi:polysaccharide biosynthesis/export family protein [Flavobacterium cucumis]|uniref:Protein involved in gliding motility EpsA n=1 Tax=Flavobacterium cucumis TaxID=416016 RepID=A0A1M7ZWP2_9FLAO|nr:polysaccharide biosynthesis/export family protein [Flavobacterium cucumis]SHO73309.1 protein involved in gliding motility EpsA [Flavobacterium cucumis]